MVGAAQSELTVPETGPKVAATFSACSGVMQRDFDCGGEVAPLTTPVDVTFHSPASIRLSAAAAVAAANKPNNAMANLLMRISLSPNHAPDRSWPGCSFIV